jgi:protein phosphatase
VPSFEQYTLLKFMKEGYFERHLNRMRTIYKNRRDSFITRLKQSSIGSKITVLGNNAGLSLLIKFDGMTERELIEKAKANPELRGMGTTVVLLTIIGEKAYVANVGDSRLYLMEDTLTQITVDHSLVQEMIKIGELTKESARIHPDKNIITRAVGAGRDINADYFEFTLTEKSILLMCSDGLSNMVEDEQLAILLKSAKTPEKVGKKLIDTANCNGGKDNIAVIVINVDSGEV